MSRKAIFIIIGLMTIALVGLASFQLYWINNAIRLSKERFDKDVYESLRNIAERLERNEMLDVASRSARHDTKGNIWISANEGSGERYVTHESAYYDIDTLISGNHRIKFKTNKNETEFFYKKNKDDPGFVEIEEIKNYTSTGPDSIQSGTIIIDVKKLRNKSAAFNIVVKEMLELESDAEHRIHPQVLDSMLHQEFTDKGINITYEFGVFDEHENKFILAKTASREKLKNSELRANLFPNDLLGNVNYLLVNFPKKESFLLRQIWATLATSVILIGIIIFCFVYAISAILRQKKLSEIKNDFINNMTHEFKTPIATVSLATQALHEDTIMGNKETYFRYLQVIREETSRLGSQVEKVLQAATLDKKDFKLSKKDIDLQKMVKQVLGKFKLQVENRNGNLHARFDANVYKTSGDEMHLVNTLQNLLDNALKYSMENPEIMVILDNPDNSRIRIRVTDKGIGIGKGSLKRIFDKFYRVPKGNIHDIKGFGLGLSYVKSVVESHGGKVEVDSELGKGSAFSLILPTNYAS